MCVSMLIDALQSSGQNERETGENRRELSGNGTGGGVAVRVSCYGRSVSCDTHLGRDLIVYRQGLRDSMTGSQ
jgi:hypothetical protein